MEVREIDCRNKRQVEQFIHLPFSIYKDDANWTPPLHMDIKKVFDRQQHSFYQHSDAVFLMAFDETGKALGRLAVLDNSRYNALHEEKAAFFYLFECVEDVEVARNLFEYAAEWAKGRGLTKVLGPKGFTPLNGIGMLVEGFEYAPALDQPYNPAYYPQFMRELGFKKSRELLTGRLSSSDRIPEKIHYLSERVQKRFGLRVDCFKTRKQLRKIIPYLKDLYNGTLTESSGNPAITDAEVKVMANQLIWFADPRLIKILMKDDQPIGLLLAYQNISPAIRKAKGKIFPFGWIPILQELRHPYTIDINGSGVIPAYRGLGGTAVLFSEIEKSLLEGEFEYAEIIQIGTENDKMLRELDSLGIRFNKKHRVFEKEL